MRVRLRRLGPSCVTGWGQPRRSGRGRGDDGVSLIIALAILSVFGIGIGFILGEAQVNFKSTEVTGTIRNMTYAADGGVEYGIAQARAGYCASTVAAPPSPTPLAPGEVSATPVSLSEPGVNPSLSVTCETTAGNSLANTFGGSEGHPGYSVVTNSPAGSSNCVSLASDPVGESNQINYSASTHCATYGASGTGALYWSPAAPPTKNFYGSSYDLLGVSHYQDPSTGNVSAWAVGSNTTILSFDGSNWNAVGCVGCTRSSNLTLYGVYAVSPTSVWAVGTNGTNGVVLYDNGSDNWTLYTLTSTTSLTAVWGADATDVWAVGAGGTVEYIQPSGGSLAVTTQKLPGSLHNPNLSGVWGVTGSLAATASTLWAVGDGGMVVNSTTGGGSWSRQTTGVSANLTAVVATSSSSVWVVGASGTILQSANGGSSWSTSTSGTTANLYALYAASSGSAYDVWAVGAGGVVDYWPGSGSWSCAATPAACQTVPAGTSDLHGISGVGYGPGQVHTVGLGATILDYNGIPSSVSPVNFGQPWRAQTSPTTQTLNDVGSTPVAGGGSVEYAVGNNQSGAETILVSTDGQTWNKATVSGSQPLYGVSAARVQSASASPPVTDGTHAWAVGGGGQIYATANSGSTWATQASPTTQTLNAVFALDDTDVWAVGNNSGSAETILFYNGSTWSSVGPSLGRGQPLYGVWAADTSHVWAVGGGGTILFYNGTSWSAASSPTSSQLNGLAGISASQVWAVGNRQGNKETILFYDGSTWTSVGPSNSPPEDLNSVFAQSNSGTPQVFAVGNNGLVYFYDGTSWTQQTGPSTKVSLYGVTAVGSGNYQAWSVGAGGSIWNFNPFAPYGMSIISGGTVFNSGTTSLPSPGSGNSCNDCVDISDSGFVQGGQTCTGEPNSLLGELYLSGTYSCTTSTQPAVSESLPTPSSLWPGCTMVQASQGQQFASPCPVQSSSPSVQNLSCGSYAQFSPGIYTSSFGRLFQQKSLNAFFQSGVYYLDNVGTVVINSSGSYIVGGMPASPTTNPALVGTENPSVASSSPCWSYMQAHDSNNGSGVEFILGGNSSIQILDGNVELFGRSGGSSAEGAQGISIREACSPSSSALSSPVACTGGWDASLPGASNQILSMKASQLGNGNNPNQGKPALDVHSAIYAPDDNVDLYSNTNTAGLGTTVGAIDCWSLELSVQNYTSPAIRAQAGGPLAVRRVIFTALAQGGTGSIPVKEEAVVVIDGPAPDDVQSVSTWRYCTPPGATTTLCSA